MLLGEDGVARRAELLQGEGGRQGTEEDNFLPFSQKVL